MSLSLSLANEVDSALFYHLAQHLPFLNFYSLLVLNICLQHLSIDSISGDHLSFLQDACAQIVFLPFRLSGFSLLEGIGTLIHLCWALPRVVYVREPSP